MPFRDQSAKRQYDKKYYQTRTKQLRSDKTTKKSFDVYRTQSNLTYPMYLDEPDPSNLSLTYKIGRRRLREFKSVLLLEFPYQDGYHIWMNRVEGKGIDVKVWKNGQLVVVMELTNYGRNSVINDKTVKRYLDSFAKYECKKILVVSYNQNISAKNEKQLIMQGIDLKVVGHQAQQ